MLVHCVRPLRAAPLGGGVHAVAALAVTTSHVARYRAGEVRRPVVMVDTCSAHALDAASWPAACGAPPLLFGAEVCPCGGRTAQYAAFV